MCLTDCAMCLNINYTLHCTRVLADIGRAENPAAGCFPDNRGGNRCKGTATGRHPHRQEEPKGNISCLLSLLYLFYMYVGLTCFSSVPYTDEAEWGNFLCQEDCRRVSGAVRTCPSRGQGRYQISECGRGVTVGCKFFLHGKKLI